MYEPNGNHVQKNTAVVRPEEKSDPEKLDLWRSQTNNILEKSNPRRSWTQEKSDPREIVPVDKAVPGEVGLVEKSDPQFLFSVHFYATPHICLFRGWTNCTHPPPPKIGYTQLRSALSH